VAGVTFFREVASFKIWVVQLIAMALVSFGQRLVLKLNGQYGATASAAVLTFRKVASFVTSVIVFPKPFHPLHAVGLCVIVLSAVMIQRSEAHASLQRKIRSAAASSGRVQESV
jgi:drug/metabolite transporter (DMT)-like permease